MSSSPPQGQESDVDVIDILRDYITMNSSKMHEQFSWLGLIIRQFIRILKIIYFTGLIIYALCALLYVLIWTFIPVLKVIACIVTPLCLSMFFIEYVESKRRERRWRPYHAKALLERLWTKAHEAYDCSPPSQVLRHAVYKVETVYTSLEDFLRTYRLAEPKKSEIKAWKREFAEAEEKPNDDIALWLEMAWDNKRCSFWAQLKHILEVRKSLLVGFARSLPSMPQGQALQDAKAWLDTHFELLCDDIEQFDTNEWAKIVREFESGRGNEASGDETLYRGITEAVTGLQLRRRG